jgi:hypothetical protein
MTGTAAKRKPMPAKNKFSGICECCGVSVAPEQGKLEYVGRYHAGQRRKSPYKLWCVSCYNRSDNSSEEDRCCGDRAYENQCAAQCDFNFGGPALGDT